MYRCGAFKEFSGFTHGGKSSPESSDFVVGGALILLHTNTRQGKLSELIIIERKIEFGLKCTEGGKRNQPVTDDTILDAVVFESGENFIAGSIVGRTEVRLKEWTVLQYLMREVGHTDFPGIGEVLERTFCLCGKLRLSKTKENETREKGDISGGHLLTC